MNPAALTPAKFRRIAEKYFNDPKDINVICGICRNLAEEFGRSNNEDESCYRQMEKLMQQIGYESNFRYEKDTYLDYSHYIHYYTIEAWQSRAWMCLFMAEFLEDGTIVGSL